MGISLGCKNMIDTEILLTLCLTIVLGFTQDDPALDETPLTVNVVSGSTAILPCSVDPTYTEVSTDQYIVLWRNPAKTVISMAERRVLGDMRMSVERPFVSDWNLHIRNVSVGDKGEYKCQINTDPVNTRRVRLEVQVPPTIVATSRPDHVKVRVGDHVDLMCNATGIPTPTITWYRVNSWTGKRKQKIGKPGEVLRIQNISRGCADTYECLANNSVPPSVSRQIIVTVQYPPEIRLRNTRISQLEGKETILECIITASPLGVTAWKRNNRELAHSNRYELDIYNDGQNTVTLSLRIPHITKEDFGDYRCEASNSLGRTYAIMKLIEVFPTTTTTSTTTSTTTARRRVFGYDADNDKSRHQHSWNDNKFVDRNKLTGNGHNSHVSNKRPATASPENDKHSAEKQFTGVYGTGSVKYGASSSGHFVNQQLCLLTSVIPVLSWFLS